MSTDNPPTADSLIMEAQFVATLKAMTDEQFSKFLRCLKDEIQQGVLLIDNETNRATVREPLMLHQVSYAQGRNTS